jgi:hypothetical protein
MKKLTGLFALANSYMEIEVEFSFNATYGRGPGDN